MTRNFAADSAKHVKRKRHSVKNATKRGERSEIYKKRGPSQNSAASSMSVIAADDWAAAVAMLAPDGHVPGLPPSWNGGKAMHTERR